MARGTLRCRVAAELPLPAADPPRAGGKSPRAAPPSRHRCGRAAPSAGACRGQGEPPGALRFTIPTPAPRRIARFARCGIGRTGADPQGYAITPAQPAARRPASGPGPVTGPGACRHQTGARRVTAASARGAAHQPGPAARTCGLALATGALARKRQRCKPIGRLVAIPFMRFLLVIRQELAGIAAWLPAGKVRAPGGSSRPDFVTNTCASYGARHRSADRS